jgi:hypothetical protein
LFFGEVVRTAAMVQHMSEYIPKSLLTNGDQTARKHAEELARKREAEETTRKQRDATDTKASAGQAGKREDDQEPNPVKNHHNA